MPVYTPMADSFSPIKIAEFVSDHIVEEIEFRLEYGLMTPSPDVEFIDFGKSLGIYRPAVAYALSTFYSESDQYEVFKFGSTSGTKIWINDQMVFHRNDDYNLSAKLDEQSYVLPEEFNAKLQKGENKVLVKSAFSGKGDWKFFLQSMNMGLYAEKGKKITPSIRKYAPDINLTNWLLLGCFENHKGRGLDYSYEPEDSIVFHKIYQSAGNVFTWDIPRIHLITQQPEEGRFYRWVYHVGGFIWGLQHLSKVTGDNKYQDYASRWCNYILSTMPLTDYQMNELHATRSMNWRMSMLDYTAAPSIPYISRLINEKTFPERIIYEKYIESIIDYVRNEQYRLSNGLFARNYLAYPTVWADDIFMGTPFLLLAAVYTEDENIRNELFNDASNQIIQCNKLLYDKEKQLYHQACFVDHPEFVVPFWSRGNGWAIWGVSEALLHLPEDHQHYEQILEIFRKHVDGIIKMQDKDGYWHNILDMPETVRESSGTAIFTLCIARGINKGWLDKEKYGPAIEKGWSAVKSFIGSDGNLYGVKGGTNFSTDPEDYERIPFLKSDTHGIFPLIFLCIEMAHYYDLEEICNGQNSRNRIQTGPRKGS